MSTVFKIRDKDNAKKYLENQLNVFETLSLEHKSNFRNEIKKIKKYLFKIDDVFDLYDDLVLLVPNNYSEYNKNLKYISHIPKDLSIVKHFSFNFDLSISYTQETFTIRIIDTKYNVEFEKLVVFKNDKLNSSENVYLTKEFLEIDFTEPMVNSLVKELTSKQVLLNNILQVKNLEFAPDFIKDMVLFK